MKLVWTILVCAVCGYALGGFPTGYLVGKKKNIDIREHGSGNIGTTNSIRVMGLRAGAVTFIGDVIKCIAALLLATYLCRNWGCPAKLIQLLTAFFVILGHDYPIALGFRGGKGIAATAGLLLVYDWRLMLVCLITFLLILVFTRYVSLGSLVVSLLLPIGTAVLYHGAEGFPWMLLITVLICVLAFWRHRENIGRLLAGKENKFGDHAD